MLLGLSCNAVFVLSRGSGMGNPAVLSIGWGFAVGSGIYIAGGASGGHINPAVTTSLALCRLFPWDKVPLYVLAQYLGAFVACPFVYIAYVDSMNYIDGGIRQTSGINATAGIFATYPMPHVSTGGAFADQVKLFTTDINAYGCF
ncbi:hypothetical protein KUTeg_013543 [Tegillarca granosa]|uniref:Aquaporin n=1 Tax=Tegillarca granosa TaxID=220873 RepID=A0ABQ9EUC7_TEGGR|nr:hypothetical protein KUTeg_013543 [Tegillarca granosa]